MPGTRVITRRLLSGIWITALLLSAALAQGSGLDALDLELRSGYRHPLHWQNVEGPPLLVSGPTPVYKHSRGRHEVTLLPGHSVQVHLPALAALRLMGTPSPAAGMTPVALLSNGSGLWKPVQWHTDPTDSALMIYPDSVDPLYCRIIWPRAAENPARLALFVSRRQVVTDIAPYRELVALDHVEQRVISAQHGGQRYWQLSPGKTAACAVNGPGRIKIATRLVYAETITQRQQRYRLFYEIDRDEPVSLSFETRPAEDRVFRSGSGALVLGRLENRYIEIPPGRHVIRLRGDPATTRDVLLRVLFQDRPDYLVPRRNAPFPLPADLPAEALPPSAAERSRLLATVDSDEILDQLDPLFWDEAISSLFRENSRNACGLPALVRLLDHTRQRPEATDLRGRAEGLYRRHTAFHHLVPVADNQPLRQISCRFISPRLEPLTARQTVAARQHRQDLVQMVPRAYFTPLPEAAHRLVYHLPERQSRGELQLISRGQSEPYELLVQIGTAAPVRLQAESAAVVPAAARQTLLPEMGLAMEISGEQPRGPGLANGLLTDDDQTLPLVRAGTITLPLPSSAGRVSIYTESPTEAMVALRYREALPFQMSEQEYLEAIRSLSPDSNGYRKLLAALKTPDQLPSDEQPAAWKDLLSDWRPLFRTLRYRAELFSAAVSPLPEDHFLRGRPVAGTNTPADPDQARQLIETARSFQSDRQWLPALECWCEAAAVCQEDQRLEVLFAIVTSLENLGEPYLAEMILRGMYVFPFGASSAEMAATAFERLAEIYRRDHDNNRLALLYADRALRNPEPATLRTLCRIFAEDNQFREAIQIGLTLPPAQQPLPIMLRAADRLHWRQLYDSLVERLESQQEQAAWQALDRLRTGDIEAAGQLLDQAGSANRPMAEMLGAALQIRDLLAADQIQTRLQGVLAWEKWQENRPGPYCWQNAPEMIEAHGGGLTIHHQPRDLRVQGYLARPDQPVKIAVYGPVRMRLICRPLHPEGTAATPQNDWITISDDQTRRFLPVTHNRPAPAMKLVGDKRRPGEEAVLEFDVPAGPHEFRVVPENRASLVRLKVRRPQLPFPLLPPPTRQNVAAVLTAPFRPPELPTVCPDGGWSAGTAVMINPDGSTQTYPRSSLYARLPFYHQAAPPDEAWRRLAVGRQKRPPGPAHALAAGDFRLALARCAETTPAEIREKMIILLRLGESDLARPELTTEMAEAEARALFARHPDVPGLGNLLTRLSLNRSLGWQKIETVYGKAGIRYIQVPRWSSVTPHARIRKALLGPKSPTEEILSDDHRLIIGGRSDPITGLRLDLECGDLPFLRPAVMEVSYRVDDRSAHHLALRSGQKRSLRLAFDPDRTAYSVRVNVREKKSNQFLRVKVDLPEEKLSSSAAGRRPYRERGYHVATNEAPIRVPVTGPTWLRIDQWRDGRLLTEYRFLSPGRHTLLLGAGPGGKEALYQLYQRSRDFSKKPAPPDLRDKPVVLTPSPERCRPAAEETAPTLPEFRAPFSHGRYEDGTWSVGGNLNHHRSLFEDYSREKKAEEFLEIFATHRFHLQHRPWYFKTRWFTRYRDGGGPTLGISEDIEVYPRYSPFHFRLRGEAWAQNPEAGRLDYFDLSDPEWSARLTATAWQSRAITPQIRHYPTVSIFGRALSLSENSRDTDGEIDQDVYTPYKHDHPAGLTLSERVAYRPWLDTIWTGGMGLTSNASLNPLDPDHASWWCQWQQLLSPLMVEAGFRMAHYFSDDDRRESYRRHWLGLGASWNARLSNRDRLEIRLRFNRLLDRDEYNAGIGLVWHFNRHQDWQDFPPGEPAFRTIRMKKRLGKGAVPR